MEYTLRNALLRYLIMYECQFFQVDNGYIEINIRILFLYMIVMSIYQSI